MADPAGLISLGIEAAKAIKTYYDGFKAYDDDIAQTKNVLSQLQANLESVQPYLVDKNREVAPSTESQLEQAIRECDSNINRLVKKGRKLTTGNFDASVIGNSTSLRKRATYPFKKSTLTKLREIVEDSQTHLHFALEMVGLDRSETVKRGIDVLVDNEQLREALNWLPRIDLAAQRYDLSLSVTQGTGKAFLDSIEFQTWMKGSGRVIYCEGVAGAGKSTLSCIVLNHLEENKPQLDSCVFYWFCNYRMQASDFPEQLCGSFLAQLINQIGQVPPQIQKLRDSCSKNGTKPTARDLSCCLKSFIQQRTAEGKRDFLVIDALDEHGRDSHSRKALLELVDDVRGPSASKSALSFLLTSRPLPEVKEFLRGKSSGAPLIERPIVAESQDLQLYLASEVPRLDSNIKQNAQLCSEICEQVAAKADGIFLLAKLHMEFVIEQALTVRRAHKAIKNLPKGHKALTVRYNEAMERIQSQPEGRKTFALALLKWVSFAQRPLYSDEMPHALALEDYDDDDVNADFDVEDLPSLSSVVSSCAGLVVVAEKTRIVQFAHLTVDEFFREHRHTLYATAELDLTRKCLLYLSLQRYQWVSGGLAKANKLWLDEYCRNAWSHHARLADNEGLPYTMPFISDREWFKFACRPEDPLMTALHLVAELGMVEHIRALLSDGFDVEAMTRDDLTAMSLAAINGQSMALKVLVEEFHAKCNGFSDFESSEGCTLVEQVCEKQHWECLEVILDAYSTEIGIHDRGSALRYLKNLPESSAKVGLKILLFLGPLSDDDVSILALHAVLEGSKLAIDVMVEQGFDVSIILSERSLRDFRSKTFHGRYTGSRNLLTYAICLDRKNMIAVLRRYGAIFPEERPLLDDLMVSVVANGNIDLLTEWLNVLGDKIRSLSREAGFYEKVLVSAAESNNEEVEPVLICLRLLLENERVADGGTLSKEALDVLTRSVSRKSNQKIDWREREEIRYKRHNSAGSESRTYPLRVAVILDAPDYFATFLGHPTFSDHGDLGYLVQLACAHRSAESLLTLVQQGANVNGPRFPFGRSALTIVRKKRESDQSGYNRYPNSSAKQKFWFWLSMQRHELMEFVLLCHGAREHEDEADNVLDPRYEIPSRAYEHNDFLRIVLRDVSTSRRLADGPN